MTSTIIEHPSPNHSERKKGTRVDTVLLHHTGTDAAGRWSNRSARNTLCNPEGGVSAHYLVETTGRILRLVPEHRKAWHAGKGRLPWETCPPYDFNHRSIGIELVNPGDGVTPFTEAQYLALAWLVPDIVRRLGWGLAFVANGARSLLMEAEGSRLASSPDGLPGVILGHRDVAPGRKTDPADNFDWNRMRQALAGGVA